ncbi:class I SAM-dependent methyltransferase [Brucella intermedia]|uniref:class I SAM-dependent methyltransferase n=1 Tax=Brucella intermedia TaxID=94625 RepID=UPI00235FEDDE|nr:class I SAM-dependent methyltransferase [Brucella intermedia]
MYLNSQSLKPSLHIRDSAWLEHSPFAFWLIDVLRPNKLVELGTHNGFSFLSQCQVVKSLNLDASVYAIDTWQGDEHAGFYGNNVYESLEEEVRAMYPGIGRMVRATFADARSQFDNSSVDLLHIDGRHRYEDVKGDFQTWVDTLSDKGVVLFHDTSVRRGDFGVYKFWAEISLNYPSFEFYHGHGLGVLLVGKNVPQILIDLCTGSFEQENFIREAYARLGFINTCQYEETKFSGIQQQLQHKININNLTIDEKNATISKISEELNFLDRKIEDINNVNRINTCKLNQENAELKDKLKYMERMNRDILSSTSWRITWPMRAIKTIFIR